MQNPSPPPQYESLLQFWFGDADAPTIAKAQSALWWGKSAETDELIRDRFGALRERAITGELEAWEAEPRGRLALIVLVDQLSRNIFRGRPESFTYDYLAQEWCLNGIDLGADEALRPIERVFFYLPLEHSESRVDQSRSVALYTVLAQAAAPAERETFAGFLDFARRHRDIIERFGRFPHRNEILGRESTPEEVEFLKEPGSGF